MRRFVAGIVLACAAGTAFAGSFEARVTHVSDGDTLWVRPLADAAGPPRSIRIAGIDAPEVCQASGIESRAALRSRVEHRTVLIESQGVDDFGRTLARVRLGRQDIGRRLVREGHAWSYRFRRDRGPYAREERLARVAHRGLWAGSHPEEPRDFRRRHGACPEHGE